MSETDKVSHLWRVAEMVGRLEKYLQEGGRLDDGTRQRIIEIRLALLDGVESAVQKGAFSSGLTPPPI